MEAFDSIYNNQIWLSHIVQDIFQIVYQETNLMINSKISRVLQILNINEKSYSNDKFLVRFRTFFQENFSLIFDFTDEFSHEIQNKMKNCCKDYKNFNLLNDLQQDMESKSFKALLNIIFKLSIYMILHDPVLIPKIKKYSERELEYFYYTKNDYINIEGFGKDQSPCILILNPPVFSKNKYPYQGIKPAVCMAANVNKNIIDSCETTKIYKDSIKIQSEEINSSNNVNNIINMPIIIKEIMEEPHESIYILII